MSRLFFALYPDAGVRAKLHTLIGGSLSGRPVQLENLHLTLVFLGNVDPERQSALAGAVDRVAVPSFDLRIDACGWWQRSRLFWAAPAHPPGALLALHQQILRLAAGCQIAVEDRAYRPHITLARKVKTSVRAEFAPVEWTVREFCLFISTTRDEGPEYEIIQRWPLT